MQPNLISSNLKEDAKSIKKNVCIWFLVLYKIFYTKIAPSRGHLLVGKRTILKFSASVLFSISWNLTRFQLIQTTNRKMKKKKSEWVEWAELCKVSRNPKSNRCWKFQLSIKVIHPKYSKHWPYTVAYTIDCVCSKILNHGLNDGLSYSLFKFFLMKQHSKLTWKLRIKI